MLHRLRLIAILLLALYAAPSTPAATVVVRVLNFYFTPTNITINPGDTVTWRNDSPTPHDSTHANFENPLWSGFMAGFGDTFSFTFTEPGFYPYVCTLHVFGIGPQQTGTVTVAQANLPPAVRLTSPANNSTFAAPAGFTATAEASDPDGAVARVEFFVNGNSVGVSQGPAYSAAVAGLGVGTHTLTAVATDDSGAQTTSDPISISVEEASPDTFSLTAAVAPAGSGSVQISPPPNAPDDKYLAGTPVTLTAVAGADRAFASWSGSVASTENPLAITMNSDLAVTANFITATVPGFTLTLATNPPGAGTIDASPAPNGPNGTYLAGTVVTLTASAGFGHAFSNWSGAVSSAENTVIITMDEAKSVAANFVQVQTVTYTLTLATNPPGAGQITVAPAPNAPGGAYIAGTVVTLTATATGTNAFATWTGDATGASNRVTLVLDGNKSATANFVPIVPARFTLAATVAPPNAGTILLNPVPAQDGTYAGGTSVAVAALPERNFRFVRWSGAVSSSNNPIVVVMNADRELVAHFEEAPGLDFNDARGTYAGLLLDDDETNFATSGFLSLRVTKPGRYTGVARIGGIRQPVNGRFDRFGYAPLTLRRGTLRGSLQIEPEQQRISGVLTDGSRSPRLLLYRMITASNAALVVGSHGLVFETNNVVANAGTGILQITAHGTARVRGTLGDGVTFVDRTFLSPDGLVPLFAPLYGNRGLLIGWIALMENEPPAGVLRWFRPGDSRHPNYPAGFATETVVAGAPGE